MLLALLDSNVVIAALVEDHIHNETSAALLTEFGPYRFGVAAHSYAEAYVALTRQGRFGGIEFPPDQAWTALEGLRGITRLLGLTAPQIVDAIGRYASARGIGPRLYDALIGEVALTHGVAAIVTWNARHLAGLFPTLEVSTPAAFMAARPASSWR